MGSLSEDALVFIENYNTDTLLASFHDIKYYVYLKTAQKFNEIITIQELSVISIRNKSVVLCFLIKTLKTIELLLREAILFEEVHEFAAFFENCLSFVHVEEKVIYLTEYVAMLYKESFPHLLALKRLSKLCEELLDIALQIKTLEKNEESKQFSCEERVEALVQLSQIIQNIFRALFDSTKAVLNNPGNAEEFEIQLIKFINKIIAGSSSEYMQQEKDAFKSEAASYTSLDNKTTNGVIINSYSLKPATLSLDNEIRQRTISENLPQNLAIDNNLAKSLIFKPGNENFEFGKRDRSLFEQIEELSSLNKVQAKHKLDLKKNFKKPERNDSKKFSRAETTMFTNIYQVLHEESQNKLVSDGVNDKLTSDQIKGFDYFYFERKIGIPTIPSEKGNKTHKDFESILGEKYDRELDESNIDKILDSHRSTIKRESSRSSVKRAGKRSKTMNPEELEPGEENKIRSKSGKQILEALESITKSEDVNGLVSPGKQRNSKRERRALEKTRSSGSPDRKQSYVSTKSSISNKSSPYPDGLSSLFNSSVRDSSSMLSTFTKAIITSKKKKKGKLGAYEEKIEQEKRDKKLLQFFSKNQTKAKIKTHSRNANEAGEFKINGVDFEDPLKFVENKKVTDLVENLVDTDNEQVMESNSSHSSSDEEIALTNEILNRKLFLKSLFDKHSQSLLKRHSAVIGLAEEQRQSIELQPFFIGNLEGLSTQIYNQYTGNLNSNMTNMFAVNTSRESVNYLIVKNMIKTKLRQREHLNKLSIIKERWSKIKFAYQMWLLWRRFFPEDRKNGETFFEEAHVIKEKMINRSLLRHLDQFLFLIERPRENRSLSIGFTDFIEDFPQKERVASYLVDFSSGLKGNPNEFEFEEKKILILERSIRFKPTRQRDQMQNFDTFNRANIKKAMNFDFKKEVNIL